MKRAVRVGDAISFIIPVATVSETNRHEHWRHRSRRAANQRFLARMCTQYAIIAPLVSIVAIKLIRIGKRRLDTGNLAAALKHVQDGVCDALDVNDGDERISWEYGQATSPLPHVLVEIREKSKATA